MKEVEGRGVDLATGHGKNLWDLNPRLSAKVKSLYDDAKKCLLAELTPDFVKTIPKVDHDVTKLVCNIADTALSPKIAANETLKIIREMAGKEVNSSRRKRYGEMSREDFNSR